ncbi:MAG TPA: hypothetical protein VIH35_00955, partial [Kiritimatiellia bacterium]
MRIFNRVMVFVLAAGMWAAGDAGAQCGGGTNGGPATYVATVPVLDGYLDTNMFTLITESGFASPLTGGSTNYSDATGEGAASRIYDCNSDPDVGDF